MKLAFFDEFRWLFQSIRPRKRQISLASPKQSLSRRAGLVRKISSYLISVTRLYVRNISRYLHLAYKKLLNSRDEIDLLRNGVGNIITPARDMSISSDRGSLYIAYNSLPYHSAGYATRTQGLASGLRQQGVDATVVTRAGYPGVFKQFRHHKQLSNEIIDGVPYIRSTVDPKLLFGISTKRSLQLNIDATSTIARDLRPCVVHGASNFLTGLTAVGVARTLGVPCVYEVRGLWEITALSRDPSYAGTLHFAQAVRLETEACLNADRVIAITGALKDELVRRGVPSDKISVVPNGVDTARFRPLPRDAELGAQLGISAEHVVVGYVGSILDYEGVDDLLRAVRKCVDRGATNLRLLIVGDGAAYTSCIALSRELELQEHVIFTGRVPFEHVENYYSLIDIAPFPRKPLPVCEMVSPLKPFEAMAMGKCVIVSSVAALAEIVGDRPIGFIFDKGSVASLTETLLHVVSNRELRLRTGEEARKFTLAERDWRSLAKRVAKIYEELSSENFEVVPAAAPKIRHPA